MQAATALRAASRQLFRVSTGEGVVTTLWHTYGIMERYTPSVVPAMRAARQQHGEIQFHAINLMHVPIALFSMAVLPVLIVVAMRRGAIAQCGLLGATVLMALFLNSFVCGALSNPHDRYGARLIWLAPLTWVSGCCRLESDGAASNSHLRQSGYTSRPLRYLALPRGIVCHPVSIRTAMADLAYSACGVVSRVAPVHTAMRNCTRDEGRSFEVGNQVLISSHRKLLSSKAMVVNVAEKSEQDSDRQG